MTKKSGLAQWLLILPCEAEGRREERGVFDLIKVVVVTCFTRRGTAFFLIAPNSTLDFRDLARWYQHDFPSNRLLRKPPVRLWMTNYGQGFNYTTLHPDINRYVSHTQKEIFWVLFLPDSSWIINPLVTTILPICLPNNSGTISGGENGWKASGIFKNPSPSC